MDIHQYIESQTRNNEDQKFKSKPKFKKVKKDKKPKKSPQEKGERPVMLDISNTESVSDEQNSKPRRSKKKSTPQQPIASQDSIETTTPVRQQFCEIIPSVREVSGGYNTQSNEVIEKRHRANQKQLRMSEESGNVRNAPSLDATGTTFSSETTDSYKTALQDSLNTRPLDQRQNTNAANNYPDKDESSTECSSDFMDASASMNDIQIEMGRLNIKSDKDNMSDELIVRLLQSKEDEDVYEHPLRHVRNDPEWRRRRLQRQGIEVTQTPKDYFMNLDDDNFVFDTKK
ncbi:uncharacterized protein LOC100680355 isoform X2 [Nasonia vitripennis]|uniref:Uncharacterized protein n=1 Tax=Nasonia vitripennis TaxID=7425 RepID=A0A7M7QXM2_NASVI|nr:uncharacterized protein LOC100680355 isoform X2 [Nasonia vitripennis]XP_032455265.1 uncharacterized protein LOC100680355 isoform X2 [Nasonia vitripennis]XP_032455266.1 uncharacterized protein LOC100680355 isoform X2 [Nasonia vitripennis]